MTNLNVIRSKRIQPRNSFGLNTDNLLTSGKLKGYLADIDKQAEVMLSRLVKQMTEREDVTEQLKAEDQMEWVARMNNIRSRATEIVNHDIIYN